MNLRVKIHGNPDENDIEALNKFLNENINIKTQAVQNIEELILLMTELYAPVNINQKTKEVKKWSTSEARELALEALVRYDEKGVNFGKLVVIMDAIVQIREELPNNKDSKKDYI